MRKKLKIGVSACLIGLRYRYDGTSKFDSRLVELLRERVEFVPVCPEVECGLDVPRAPMRLEASPKGIRLKVIDSGEDVTAKMRDWMEDVFRRLGSQDLAAFIFKSKSPSCGLACPVFSREGKLLPLKGTGLFAREFRKRFPETMVCQETDFPEIAEKLRL